MAEREFSAPHNLIAIGTTTQEHASQEMEKRRIGRAEQWNAPTSLTVRELLCVKRSEARAMELQVSSFPWGNPTEAKQACARFGRLGAFHCRKDHSKLQKLEGHPMKSAKSYCLSRLDQ